MTNHEHPITLPPELFKQWEDDILNERDNVDHVLDCAWRDGYRAGADQELEACIKYFHEYDASWGEHSDLVTGLRAARRPKPPSLKEQGRQALERISNSVVMETGGAELHVLKAIVESLPD